MPHPQSAYLGHWCGTTTTPASSSFQHFTSLVILGVDKADDETPSDHAFQLCLQSRYYATRPIRPLAWLSTDEFRCSIPHWAFTCPITVQGKFLTSTTTASSSPAATSETLPAAITTVLHVTFSGSIFSDENYTVQLRRPHDDPRNAKYLRAAPSLSYTYRVPSVSSADEFFPAAHAGTEGLDVAQLEAVVEALLRLDSGKPGDARVDGLVVLRNGQTVLEEYFWGLERDEVHEISSCTKSVAAVLVGVAVDRGLVGLEEVIADGFPEVGEAETTWRGGGGREPVRVRHVLAMVSGSVFEEHEGPGGLVEPGLFASEDVAREVLGSKRTAEPGEEWRYDNSLPFLVACYLERKVGMTVEAFADKYFFQPLGIKERQWTYLHQPAADGKPSVMLSGGLRLRLRDFAKIGQMMLDGGVYQGKRIVSKQYVQLATTQHTKEGQWPYGFYWHLNTKDQRHLDNIDGFLGLGQGEQVIAVLPEQKLVICWMSSTWVNKLGYRIAMKEVNEKWVKNIKV